MIIKVGILDNNINFTSKFSTAFGNRYLNDIELSTYSSYEQLYNGLESSILDVILISQFFEDDLDLSRFPKRCTVAYFVDSPGIKEIGTSPAVPAICKFQKADLIYRQILDLHAQKARNIRTNSSGDGSCSVIGFISAGCGAGSSTIAASCARHLALTQHSVLYLNLEQLGSANVYFTSDIDSNMSKIIYVLKNGKEENLSVRLRASVSKDPSGVQFFSASDNALHMTELHASEILHLLNVLKSSGDYNYIVVDMDGIIDADALPIYRMFSSLILVSDHSTASISKTERWYNAISVNDSDNDIPLANHISLILNRTSHEVPIPESLQKFDYIGSIEKYHESDPRMLMDHISNHPIINRII